jgi:hypothetical protein
MGWLANNGLKRMLKEVITVWSDTNLVSVRRDWGKPQTIHGYPVLQLGGSNQVPSEYETVVQSIWPFTAASTQALSHNWVKPARRHSHTQLALCHLENETDCCSADQLAGVKSVLTKSTSPIWAPTAHIIAFVKIPSKHCYLGISSP